MDYDFWLKFYNKWTVEQLVSEIDTCHIYQQNCMSKAFYGQSTYDYQFKQVLQSQERVKIIVQVIREKSKNGS